MDECIDIPKCDSVYITYEIRNSINFIQRISRCLRIYQNKIISGIFIWCDNNYKNINIVNKIFDEYGTNVVNNIFIKDDKNKVILNKIEKKINKKNIIKIKDNMTKKQINKTKNNKIINKTNIIDKDFINTFF
jgi:superfamily II DNA or RNA helicase